MSKIKNYFAFIAMFALLFTSCSKDENTGPTPDNQMAKLSFGAVLNDLAANATNKQSIGDLPECSQAAPAYVEVVVSQNNNPVAGTMANPLHINLSATPADYDNDGVDEYFTLESPDLELEPGNYTLDYFAVYDANDNLIWLAPRTGEGSLADYVDNPLPLDISLGAGAKKYVDVNVLCYDNRMANQYGYLFFDIETNKLLQFCIFANYCNGDGRDYPAHYSVNVWLGSDNTGTPLYTNSTNTVSTAGEDPSAEPLCFALPDLSQYGDAQDYIYYEVTLMSWPDVYGNVEPMVLTGVLSRNDIMSYYDGDTHINYDHLRFGCPIPEGDCTLDSDGDGVPNCDDQCPYQAGSPANNGCPENDCLGDRDGDGVLNCDDQCPDVPGTVANFGCPLNDCQTDTDGDGVFDCYDHCPDVQGPESNDGCPEEQGGGQCETAFMFGNTTLISLDLGNKRWGWTQHFTNATDGTTTYNLYAGAGQNDISKGYLAGTVDVTIAGNDVSVTLHPASGVSLDELHVFLSDNAPTTTAPGQYGNTEDNPTANHAYNFTYSGDGSFWLIVHTVVCK